MHHEEKLTSQESGLLHFLTPSEEKLNFLTLGSNPYLPFLRQMFPHAALYAVTEQEDAPEEAGQGLEDVSWTICDFFREDMPYPDGFFDYILADRILEQTRRSDALATTLLSYLKETGHLLTSFTNVRYWEIVQDLREGHFYPICRFLFAKPEMVRLLGNSHYKEIVFSPQEQSAPAEVLNQLVDLGFQNDQQDLATRIWRVKASRSRAETAALKVCYTPQVRQELAVLLRRIEYGIDSEENAIRLWQFYEKEGLFSAYLNDFIRETSRHATVLWMHLKAAAESPTAKAACREIEELGNG